MLPNYVLAAERLEMAFAVETRPPFLDHLLFDIIRRLPLSALVSERQGKQALRKAAQRILPESVIAQRKHPFAAPLDLSQPGSALFKKVDEVFRSGILNTMPFFDTQAVLALWTHLSELPALRRAALEPALLMIFCSCVLHQRYISN
jgi:asparagine synthase (glutamine-hydrolysing)